MGAEGGVCAQATGALACEQQTHFRSSVTSLPPKSSYFWEGETRRPEMRLLFAGYWSPDSQYFNFIFSLLKSLLLGRCSGGTILGSPPPLSSISPVPSGEPAPGLSTKLFETFNWILMRSGENYFDKKIDKLIAKLKV